VAKGQDAQPNDMSKKFTNATCHSHLLLLCKFVIVKIVKLNHDSHNHNLSVTATGV